MIRNTVIQSARLQAQTKYVIDFVNIEKCALHCCVCV